MTAGVAGSVVGAVLDLYDVAYPVLFDMEAGARRTDIGVLERVVDHGGRQYRVTVRSGAGVALGGSYRHVHLGRREAAVEAALQRLAGRHNAALPVERRGYTVTAPASEIQASLAAASQVFSFAEICDAVRLLNAASVEVGSLGAPGPAIGTKGFPEIGMEQLPAGDTQVTVRFNDSPMTARRLGLTPDGPLP